MSHSVLDKVRGWRKPRDRIEERITERQPELIDTPLIEAEPEYVPDMDLPDVFINHLKQMSINITTGRWRITTNIADMIQFYDSAKILIVLVRGAKPDEQFRKEIIKAEREPDYVEQGKAIYEACLSLWDRRSLLMREKAPEGEFDEDWDETLGDRHSDVDLDDDMDYEEGVHGIDETSED